MRIQSQHANTTSSKVGSLCNHNSTGWLKPKKRLTTHATGTEHIGMRIRCCLGGGSTDIVGCLMCVPTIAMIVVATHSVPTTRDQTRQTTRHHNLGVCTATAMMANQQVCSPTANHPHSVVAYPQNPNEALTAVGHEAPEYG